MEKRWYQTPRIQTTRVRMALTPHLSLVHALFGGFGKEWACS
jgi:hypothetical protein